MARFRSLLSFLIPVAQRRSISAHGCDFYPSTDSSLQQEIVNKSLPILHVDRKDSGRLGDPAQGLCCDATYQAN